MIRSLHFVSKKLSVWLVGAHKTSQAISRWWSRKDKEIPYQLFTFGSAGGLSVRAFCTQHTKWITGMSTCTTSRVYQLQKKRRTYMMNSQVVCYETTHEGCYWQQVMCRHWHFWGRQTERKAEASKRSVDCASYVALLRRWLCYLLACFWAGLVGWSWQNIHWDFQWPSSCLYSVVLDDYTRTCMHAEGNNC